MKKVLVTGGAGFIGSNLCNIFANEGYQVIALDNLMLGKWDHLSPSVHRVEGDAGNIEHLNGIGDVDYLIHLAASSSAPMFIENLTDSVLNNIRGQISVLEFCRAKNVEKILFASTSSVYGNNPVPLDEGQHLNPPNFYAVSKHCQEELSRVYNSLHATEIIAFRFMSVYGPNEDHKGQYANLVSQFIWAMERGEQPVIYGDGLQTRDFVNVRDVVAAFLLGLRTPKRFGFEIFNVGSSRSINIRELVTLINRVMGTNISPIHIDNPVKSGYINSQHADLSKIKSELGYQPAVVLEEGIAEIVNRRKAHSLSAASPGRI